MSTIVQVTYRGTGNPYFLAGTTWTSTRARASTFGSEKDAQAALAKAMKFTKPRLFAQAYTAPEYITN